MSERGFKYILAKSIRLVLQQKHKSILLFRPIKLKRKSFSDKHDEGHVFPKTSHSPCTKMKLLA
jgi:hypothetical protein